MGLNVECRCRRFPHFVGHFFGLRFQHEWHEAVNDIRPFHRFLDEFFAPLGVLETMFPDNSLEEREI